MRGWAKGNETAGVSWRRFLAIAALAVAFSAGAAGAAHANVTVQLSQQLVDAIRAAGSAPLVQQRRLERDFNDGLRELGRTNADAQALFASGQTIRIVCYGSEEAVAAGLEAAEGLFGPTPAETRGAFAPNGAPAASGVTIIAVDCEQWIAKGLDTPLFDIDPNSTLFRILIHELLHASNAARRHPPDSLSLYEAFVQEFLVALARVRSGAATPAPTPAPATGAVAPATTQPGTVPANTQTGALVPPETNPLCGLLGGLLAGPVPAAPANNPLGGLLGGLLGGAPPASPPGNPLGGLLGGLLGGAGTTAAPQNPLCGLLGGLFGGERAGLSAAASVSVVGLPNAFGIGTVVTTGAETFVAGAQYGITRGGFNLGAALALDRSVFGGAGSLFLDFGWATGALSSTGQAEVGADGVSKVGLTFLYLDGIHGTGVGTDFAGDELVGNAAFSNTWSITTFGYNEVVAAPVGPAGSRIDYSIGLSFERLQQGGIAHADIIRADAILVSQETFTSTIDRYFGFRLEGGWTSVLGPNAEFRLSGFVTPSLHHGWGAMEQFTDFGGGITQALDFEERNLAIAAGIGAEFGFRCCGEGGNLGIVLGAEISVLTGVTTAQVPANPLLQPAAFEAAPMPRLFAFGGLQAKF